MFLVDTRSIASLQFIKNLFLYTMVSIEQLYQIYLQHPNISTDTRKITTGSIFFALRGDKFDANTFAEKAIEAGAAFAVIDNPAFQLNEKYLLVNDTLVALQQLAKHHRQQLRIPVIGLTGSNGKTTTKELIYSVLTQQYNTLATQGNLNNHIGVPLTILKINQTHQVAVIEMGANHQKEIEFLCGIAQPTHGLITNIGKAHLEGFGGEEGVKKGKGELYDFLRKSVSLEVESLLSEVGGQKSINSNPTGVAFVNSDSAILMEMEQARGLKHVVFYGSGDSGNLISGKIIDNDPFLKLEWTNHISGKKSIVNTNLTGTYNLDNILAAICTGVYFKLSDDMTSAGIEVYQPKNNRSQIVQTQSNVLICDYYNANPSSMAVAITNLEQMKAGKKVIILGDMFELGDESAAEHETIIKKTLEANFDESIFVGKAFAQAGLTMNHGPWTMDNKPKYFQTTADAITFFKNNPVQNSTILIKGSRGMTMERLVELF